ncbi:PcfJ domain-containing protein [Aeromonas caviae]|uniref:PcfJ domain-containing protein n=1 Tax=Aeromonas caviae TaxID=648 RepID=UPI0038591FBC
MTFEDYKGQEVSSQEIFHSKFIRHKDNKKEISLDDLFKLCVERGVFRVIKKETDSRYIHLTICGTFRIRKNLSTNAVSRQLVCYKEERREWKNTKSTPCATPLFFRTGHYINEWIRFAIDKVIDSVLREGFTIKGSMWLWDVDGYHGRDLYASISSKPYKELGFHEHQVTSKEALPFSISSNKVTPLPKGYGYGFGVHGLKDLVSRLIESRSWSFLDMKTRNDCGRHIAYSLWRFVDKNKCSLYLKACHSVLGEGNLYSSFYSYLKFCEKIKVDDSDVSSIKSLWPFIGLLTKRNGRFIISNKIRELYETISPAGMSYADFKALRNTPIKISALIADMPASRLPNGIISFEREDCRIALKLIRNPSLKMYPSTVIQRVLGNMIISRVANGLGDKVYRVCDKWLDYNKELYERIGFKKSELRWNTEINQLSHVIDWVRLSNPEIHKNQSWYSFWKLAEAWTRQQQEDHSESDLPAEWAGTGIDWRDDVVELTSRDLLIKEGMEMEHCVPSFHSQCADGCYFAFSVKHNGERSTLGVMKVDSGFKIDQVRGFDNTPVSKSMDNYCKKILKKMISQAVL